MVIWGCVAALGAAAFGVLALHRGETINAAWLVIAAICFYSVAYRFYSRFLAVRVLQLDDSRVTPAERLDNGVDFVPTNKWVLYGTTSRQSRAPGRRSDLSWPLSSGISPERSG